MTSQMDYYTRHLYGQQRLRFEDQRIRVRTAFTPDPRAVSLTWKSYSRYRDRCDLCRAPAAASAGRQQHLVAPETAAAQRSTEPEYANYVAGCAPGTETTAAADADASPTDKLPEYVELVTAAILNGPHEKYGDWPRPPLTSMDYGWWPAAMYAGCGDDALEAELWDHKRRVVNYWH